MNKQKRASCCEQCSYYDYDEYSEEYICSANMDEDEFMRFIADLAHTARILTRMTNIK